MALEPSRIAAQVLVALDHDYAGMPECDDHAGKAWHKLFKKADELGLLDDDLLEAMLSERLRRLGDPNLRLTRLDGAQVQGPKPCSLALEDGAAVLCVGNLDSTEAADLLAENAAQVAATPRLVIDLRGCEGGVEQAAYPLLDWLFDEATSLEAVVGPQCVLTNYSTGTCKAREAQFSQLKELLVAQGAADTTGWLDEGLELARANAGRGYVEETLYPAQLAVKAAPAGQRAYLLTDGRTSDAAEWLALVAKKSTRTVQVGEATRGSLDYSNPVTLAFEGRFVFTYPMSKTVEAAQGKGMRGTGVLPDVACPADEALEKALGL